MIFDASPPPPRPEVEFPVESSQQQAAQEYVSTLKPDACRAIVGELESRYLQIEGGNVLLRLEEPALLELDYTTMHYKVRGWDIEVPFGQGGGLPRAMARQFLGLFSKAEQGCLSDAETQTWARILDQVDYTSFSVDRSAPHYLEGRLLRHSPDCRVEWNDGEVQVIPTRAAEALSILEPGEDFGAFVKLGHDNEVLRIHRVSQLTGV